MSVVCADGELYSGTSADFMGRDFAIFRTLGQHHPIRTEQHDSRWLNGMKGVWVGLFTRAFRTGVCVFGYALQKPNLSKCFRHKDHH